MSREKQIKELTGVLWLNPYVRMDSHDANMLAQYLTNKCYRKQEWISVEERLPDVEGYFMVWNKEQKKIEIRFFYRLPPHYPVETYPEVREYFGNCADYKKITHWMPLPEPPKGE